MLLSLLGHTTTRREALTLFKLRRSNPDYAGTSHAEMGDALARATGARRWRWDFHARFDFASVSRSLRAQLRCGSGPTLLTFGAVHKNGSWKCAHAAVVTGATATSIELLDPLGRAPRARSAANVRLRAEGRRLLVDGNSYSVNRRAGAAVLRWR
jgi:hypothetical protein